LALIEEALSYHTSPSSNAVGRNVQSVVVVKRARNSTLSYEHESTPPSNNNNTSSMLQSCPASAATCMYMYSLQHRRALILSARLTTSAPAGSPSASTPVTTVPSPCLILPYTTSDTRAIRADCCSAPTPLQHHRNLSLSTPASSTLLFYSQPPTSPPRTTTSSAPPPHTSARA
jgi:hypothetical protein